MPETTILNESEVAELESQSQKSSLDYAEVDAVLRRVPALCQTVRALRARLEESEAHNRVLNERLVVADGVYNARGEYTLHAQTAISRATSELHGQLAAAIQENKSIRELGEYACEVDEKSADEERIAAIGKGNRLETTPASLRAAAEEILDYLNFDTSMSEVQQDADQIVIILERIIKELEARRAGGEK